MQHCWERGKQFFCPIGNDPSHGHSVLSDRTRQMFISWQQRVYIYIYIFLTLLNRTSSDRSSSLRTISSNSHISEQDDTMLYRSMSGSSSSGRAAAVTHTPTHTYVNRTQQKYTQPLFSCVTNMGNLLSAEIDQCRYLRGISTHANKKGDWLRKYWGSELNRLILA